MKKRLIILPLILLLVLLTACMPSTQPPEQDYTEYSINDVLALDFDSFETIKISVPYQIDEENYSFEIKNITEKEDRAKIREFLVDAKMVEVQEREEKQGFDGLIEIKNEDDIYLVFVDELVLINNKKFYTSTKDLGALLVDLYAEMDYEAEKLE